jgi:hypothetical protein
MLAGADADHTGARPLSEGEAEIRRGPATISGERPGERAIASLLADLVAPKPVPAADEPDRRARERRLRMDWHQAGRKTGTNLHPERTDPYGGTMNEDVFNMSVRKFLKKVGITAQREIENAVREALSKGSLTGKEKLPAKITLALGQTSLNLIVDGEIDLE